MKRAKAIVDRVVGGALALLMGVAVLNVLWQVFTRFVLEAPNSFTQELARYLLIWIGVLGAGYAVGQRAHLALDLLPEHLTGRLRTWLEYLILGCMGLFAFFVMVGGGGGLVYVQFRLGQTSPSLGWPLGWVYLVVPLSGLLMTFYVAERMVEYRAREPESAGRKAPHAEQARPGEGQAAGEESLGEKPDGEKPDAQRQPSRVQESSVNPTNQ